MKNHLSDKLNSFQYYYTAYSIRNKCIKEYVLFKNTINSRLQQKIKKSPTAVNCK